MASNMLDCVMRPFYHRRPGHTQRSLTCDITPHHLLAAVLYVRGMGRTPRAHIFYGYAFREANTWPWEGKDYKRWDALRARDWYIEEAIVHMLLGKTEDEIDEMEHTEIEELASAWPVGLGHWGYSKEPYFFLHPKDRRACMKVTWDDAARLEVPLLHCAPAEWDTLLKSFCEKMGIDTQGLSPTWLVVVSDN